MHMEMIFDIISYMDLLQTDPSIDNYQSTIF